jgi:hypothetical protein
VLEFVADSTSGLVAAPAPEGIAACIQRLANESEARRLGAGNRERVAGITWDAAVARLTQS